MGTVTHPPKPVEVVRDEDGQPGLQLNFHAGQQRVMESRARFIAAIAGTQSGKTECGPPWLLSEIYDRGPGDYFVVTPSFPLLSLKALPKFLQLFEDMFRLGKYTASPAKRFRFSREGAKRLYGREVDEPTTVFFGHADDPDSLESATAKAAWLDEAGQKKFRLGSWEAIQRRLAIYQGRALITTTPYDLGWLKQQVYDRWKKGDPDYEVVQWKSTVNPSFPQEEYERARRTLPRWRFDLFYRAVFGRPAGMIYDCFEREQHTCPRFAIPDDWPQRFLGLDFGGVNTAGVFLAQEPGTLPKKFYAYREYHAGGRTARGHAEELKRGEARVPVCVGGSKSEGQWRQEFAAGGLPVLAPTATDVEVGIDRVYAALNTGSLTVFDDLAGLLDEFESYSRETDDAGEPTEKIEDKEQYHHLDALRYIMTLLRPAVVDGPPTSTPQPGRPSFRPLGRPTFGQRPTFVQRR